MPGMEVIESYAWPEELSTSGVQTSTLTLTFRDRAGVRWEVWSDGRLKERPKPAKISRVQAIPQSVG